MRGSLLLCSESNRFVVTKVRRLSWCYAILCGNTIGDSTGTKNKDLHTMNTNIKNDSDMDSEITIAVTLEDLSEEDRRELEREIEEEQAKTIKLVLVGYQKTRDGVVKKVEKSKIYTRR